MKLNPFFLADLPINISDALKHGISGLGAIMAVLCFLLFRSEQKKPNPRKIMVIAIYSFMGFSLILVLLGMLGSPEAASAVKTYLGGFTVPHAEKQKVKELPKETSDEYELMKDISIFDLRGWIPMSDNRNAGEISPANYINYLHVKKTKPLDSIVIHYATSGYDIDLRCITQNYKVYQADTTNIDHKGEKSFGISVDVSNVPIGEEFLVVIEATYWNGFRNPKQESASTYTDSEIHGLNELDLIILLPYDKPIKDAFRSEGQHGQFQPYRENDKFYIDQNKRFVFWSIKNIKPDRHYKLDWTW